MPRGRPKKADGYDATKPAKRNDSGANLGSEVALEKAATFEDAPSAINKRKDSLCTGIQPLHRSELVEVWR